LLTSTLGSALSPCWRGGGCRGVDLAVLLRPAYDGNSDNGSCQAGARSTGDCSPIAGSGLDALDLLDDDPLEPADDPPALPAARRTPTGLSPIRPSEEFQRHELVRRHRVADEVVRRCDLGIKLVEAQAGSVPAIACGVGGARDSVIDGVSAGLYVGHERSETLLPTRLGSEIRAG
jgi:hypothetical protein